MNQFYTPSNTGNTTKPNLSQHAHTRMQQRGIRKNDLDLVLLYGRCIHARGLDFHVIGHKDVAHWATLGINLSSLSGVQVLVSPDGVVVTTYRSHNLHAIQAAPGRKSRSMRRNCH